LLQAHGADITEDEMLKLYARIEPEAEAGPYRRYCSVLRSVVDGFGKALGFVPDVLEQECLVDSLRDWLPFEDAVEALRRLKTRYRLGVISNIDDDLFFHTAKHLEVEFDWVVTAEQVGSYKPAAANFLRALNVIEIPKERILHVAQSLYHDIAPAREIGLATVWVNRRHGREGTGATLPVAAEPDLEVPDLHRLVALTNLHHQGTEEPMGV
jgi:2-haloacid dehalogenase